MQGTWIPSLVRGLRSYLNQYAAKNKFFKKVYSIHQERKGKITALISSPDYENFTSLDDFLFPLAILFFLYFQPIPSFLRDLSLWWTYLFYTSKPISASRPRLITATKTLNLFFSFSCLFSDTRHAKWLGGRPSSKSVEPLFSLVGRIPFFA